MARKKAVKKKKTKAKKAKAKPKKGLKKAKKATKKSSKKIKKKQLKKAVKKKAKAKQKAKKLKAKKVKLKKASSKKKATPKKQSKKPKEVKPKELSREAQLKERRRLGETITVCPECGSTRLIRDYERGEIICADCGLVINESIQDLGPEWRAFDSEQKAKRARGGAPTKLMRPNKGLVTEIDLYNKDIRGAKISAKQQGQLRRMRKWHKRISIATSMEKNLAIALAELDRVASALGLPDNVKENAALLYRKAVKDELVRGRLIESVVAAVIYTVCRMFNIPRTLDEISKASGIEKKEIGRAYRFLKKELSVDIPLPDPSTYVPKFATALGLSLKVQQRAMEIIKKAIKKGLISGRGPTGVAAAAVYIAATLEGERRTQKEVADVAGVTEVTIRNRYRELKKELGLKVPL